MLELNNIFFSYNDQNVFENLNLTLNEGEFAFVIGKSGSGKTTLFQMIYMNIFPQEGNIILNGFDSETIREKDIPNLRKKLGIIFQDFKLLQDRTVYENLEFVLRITGTPKKLIKRKIMQVLNDVGLPDKLNNYPGQLSGGEQQRIAIARAIINDPLLVLADEPTGNLDPETSLEIMDILKKINMRGTAVLIATHNYDLVKLYESKIYKLKEGRAVKVVIKHKNKANN